MVDRQLQWWTIVLLTMVDHVLLIGTMVDHVPFNKTLSTLVNRPWQFMVNHSHMTTIGHGQPWPILTGKAQCMLQVLILYQ